MVKNKRIEEQKKMKEQIEKGVSEVRQVVSMALEDLKKDISEGKYGRDVMQISSAIEKVENDIKNSEFILRKIAERIALIESRKKPKAKEVVNASK